MTWRTWISYKFRLSEFQMDSVLGKGLRLKTYALDKCWLLWFPRVLVACDFHPVFLNFFARKYYVEFWKLQWWWSRFLISQTLSNPFGTLRSPFVTINWHCCSCSLYSFTTAIPVKQYQSIKSCSVLQNLAQTVKYYWWTESVKSMKQSPSRIWTPRRLLTHGVIVFIGGLTWNLTPISWNAWLHVAKHKLQLSHQ